MYDPQLVDVIAAAVSRIEVEMARRAPFMAERVGAWMRDLSGSRQPADYFTHPLAFPMLLLPWWVGKTCCPRPDIAFQSDLAYSTINGYYAIRMIDNVMDGDAAIDVRMLPALNFFHTQFQSAYQAYFPGKHPFWDLFRDIWICSGESAMRDASLPDIDRAQFMQIAALKICAVKIPIAAVCYRYDRADAMPSWFQLVDLLGCWHQMMNDLFDWHKDLDHGSQTYFLSEARRRHAAEGSVAAWVVREGFAWGSDTLHAWMAELQERAQHLHSTELLAYLGERERRFLEREAQVTAGLRSIAQLSKALSSSV